MNCWEFKKCGREAGGLKSKELGVCPAHPNFGKGCARVAGTFCGGKVQGSFAEKLGNCMECDFYKSEHYGRKYENDPAAGNGVFTEKRREERIVSFKNVTLSGVGDSRYSAVSTDYSKSGLGIVTSLPVSPGDRMKVSCDHFWSSPRNGVVVWVKAMGNRGTRAGLKLF